MSLTDAQSYARAKKHHKEMMEAYQTASNMEHEARTAKTKALQEQKNAKTALETAKRSGNSAAATQAADRLKTANRTLAAARQNYRNVLNLLCIAAEATNKARNTEDYWASKV